VDLQTGARRAKGQPVRHPPPREPHRRGMASVCSGHALPQKPCHCRRRFMGESPGWPRHAQHRGERHLVLPLSEGVDITGKTTERKFRGQHHRHPRQYGRHREAPPKNVTAGTRRGSRPRRTPHHQPRKAPAHAPCTAFLPDHWGRADRAASSSWRTVPVYAKMFWEVAASHSPVRCQRPSKPRVRGPPHQEDETGPSVQSSLSRMASRTGRNARSRARGFFHRSSASRDSSVVNGNAVRANEGVASGEAGAPKLPRPALVEAGTAAVCRREAHPGERPTPSQADSAPPRTPRHSTAARCQGKPGPAPAKRRPRVISTVRSSALAPLATAKARRVRWAG